jgi:PAS domain S-box-containing protein
MKIKNKVTLYTVSLIATMVIVLVSVGYYEISHAFYRQILNEQDSRMRVAWTLLKQEGSPIEVRNGKLYAGKVLLNGNSDLVDRITTLVGGTATIFQGETRVATNVRLPDGSRALGTNLTFDKEMQRHFEGHQNYRGQTLILGEPYITAYDLIKNGDGETIGLLQVGAWKSVYNQTLESILLRSALVSLIGLCITGLIVYVALNNLTRNIQEIASKGRILLESTGEGIYSVDLQGRCNFINHIGAEMLGYEPQELIGKEIHSTIHHSHPGGETYPLIACKLCTTFAKDKIHNRSEVFWRKNRTSFAARYLSSPMSKNGVAEGAVVAFNDITMHKRAEADLHQAVQKAIGGKLINS